MGTDSQISNWPKEKDEYTMEPTTNLTLELTVDEINMVLRVLGKHPFEEVVGLIRKIKDQGDTQIAALQSAATDAPQE